VVAAAVACGGFAIASGHAAQADDPTVLNGTYRLYFDGSGSTVDGVPVAHTSATYFYAFRSACLADGCVANGTRLSPDQESSTAPGSEAAAIGRTVNLRFTDGRWVMSAPYEKPCGDGGHGSWMTEWSLTPQGKGVLTGTRKDSPGGNLCPGDGGGYLTEPMTATRERDVDPGVNVPAPG
jgi:serine/threonine-protein kinase